MAILSYSTEHGTRAIGIVLLGTILLVCAIIVRRLYFHPFSHVPGPFLAKVTNLYAACHSYKGTMHLDVQRCHQKYGDLIRYGPNQILSLHPADFTTIYGHGKPFRKSRGYETMIPIADGWSTMTSIDKGLHHNLRRTFRSGLGAEGLSRYEPAILRNLNIYFSEIMKVKDDSGWSASADMRARNLCLGFDTMAEFGLGLKTDLIRSDAKHYVFPALHVHEKKMGLWEQLPTLNDLGLGHMVGLGLLGVSSTARKFLKWYQSFLDEAISKNTTEPQGIFAPVIQSGQGLSEKPGHNKAQMIAEGSFSTFSAADGYGMLLSGFVHYLSHYPHVYEKLATELRGKFSAGQEIKWGHELESSAYLRAVIDEVMRLLPPACGVHWRECERPGITIGKDQDQLDMPVGCDVGVSIYGLFRDGRIFRRPIQFWPERWIAGTLPEEEFSHAKKMFTPFLIGPRSCAGGHVALMMASVAFAHVLVNYDFRLGPEAHETSPGLWSNTPDEIGADSDLIFESHYSIAGWKNGPYIQFKARDQSLVSV